MRRSKRRSKARNYTVRLLPSDSESAESVMAAALARREETPPPREWAASRGAAGASPPSA
ncbi:hypothetical protein VL15_23185 [Burkholderia cepacia]|uniref:Uncharacterized protein n=1 Tax=Burkholderia cepacia TaxID=292 RepID=A0A0J5ZLA0_BURCE|nr:hypothetical protein VL15_23185 [Burkholderia cepacia]